MRSNEPVEQRPLAKSMRVLLFIASGLVFLVGISLFLLSDQTSRYFAWTVRPPLTAAFLGASYWSTALLTFLSARERGWAGARLAVFSSFIFSVFMLAATLLHLDRFHFGSVFWPTGLGTWVWLLVYLLYPPAALVLLVRQYRLPGGDPPRTAPLPTWLRALMAAQATVLIVLGAGLFFLPGTVAHLWPWPLTTLTAQAIAAWLFGLGVGTGEAVWENDAYRNGNAAVSYLLFACLQLIALARYANTVSWGDARAWLYVLFLLSILVVGVAIAYPRWQHGRVAAGLAPSR